MIIFEGVSKKFSLGNWALEEVSFFLEEGEFVFLVGPSGAGKTTILKLIIREFLPTSGRIVVGDWEISSKDFELIEKLRSKIGMVFQDFRILPEKTVFENVFLAFSIKGKKVSQVKEEVMEKLRLVGLDGKENLFPAQLSAGELQRVGIARALAGDRDVILADEPTGNLDPKTSWEIMKIFKKLEGKKTIIFATHNTDLVNSLKKRVLYLKQGKLIKDEKKGKYDLI